MKQVLIKRGQPVVEEVPAPQLESGTVLVRVDSSCISTGTEIGALRTSSSPLWKRALKQPQKAKQVLQLMASQGLASTRAILEGKLSAGQPTGYSAAGVVLAIDGDDADRAGVQTGDRVACAGAQCAHHAEVIRVPRNLVVTIPDGVDFAAASTVALGAVALQSVRRLQPTLGETFVVLGLGIVGQLVSQILRVSGCRVIGTDLDRSRLRLAQELGATVGFHPDDHHDGVAQVARVTNGLGADGVVITAQSPSDQIVSSAFQMCRKKGRVVLVGDVGLHLNRADFYQKELDFLISTSYGPGRYDQRYEEQGMDYPVAYVRWTEGGNMGEYLRLLAEGKVQVLPLIAARYSVEDAPAAYAALQTGSQRPLLVVLGYPSRQDETGAQAVAVYPQAQPTQSHLVRLALVGAGSFAKGVHLPHLRALSDYYRIRAVVSRTGHNATLTAQQYGTAYATTDYQQVLDDPQIDAVLIATRHDRHADMAMSALRAGKHVFVEKPLALIRSELQAIETFYAASRAGVETPSLPILMTGFNRRFSLYARRLRELIQTRSHPMILNYRMNAGYVPRDHWTQTAAGGGRNRGEACHMYDLVTYLTDQLVASVWAQPLKAATGYYTQTDNFVATLAFRDGSIASLTYTALGTLAYPKEQLEVFVDGKVFALHDYQRLTIYGTKEKSLKSRRTDKGHKEELVAFAQAIQNGGSWPIPLWQQLQATRISFEVEQYLQSDSAHGCQIADPS